MHLVISWVCVGLLAVAIDVVVARWNICVNRGRLCEAMIWSALAPILGFVSLWACLQEMTALIPNALGCAIGTWLAMRWK